MTQGNASSRDDQPDPTVVADVIPNPPRTLLLQEAEARGAITLDGLGMLVNQGIVGIRLWTGIEVEEEPMRRTPNEIFGV